MESRTVTLSNDMQKSERFAAQLTNAASRFQSRIFLQQAERRINAKSMMGLMALSFSAGNPFEIMADGEDEQAAVAALADFFAEW